MATTESILLEAFETHSAAPIRKILDAGFDPQALIKGKSLVNSLVEMYSRSDQFRECLRLLLDRGAVLDDPVIAPVLLDDTDALNQALRADPALIHHRTSLVSAFTPLDGASLLHVAAEFGNLRAARLLIEHGAQVDARAAVDADGLNGQTPLFHTVNTNDNRGLPLMELLLAAGARTDVRLAGITWGRGFEWETICIDVTPISYAQLGLLRQMQRRERHIYDNMIRLLEAAGRRVPAFANVPNRYLAS